MFKFTVFKNIPKQCIYFVCLGVQVQKYYEGLLILDGNIFCSTFACMQRNPYFNAIADKVGDISFSYLSCPVISKLRVVQIVLLRRICPQQTFCWDGSNPIVTI
jgi:hypothetical protein